MHPLISTIRTGVGLQHFTRLRPGCPLPKRKGRPEGRPLRYEDGTSRCYSAALVEAAALAGPIPTCRLVPACSLKLPLSLEKVAES